MKRKLLVLFAVMLVVLLCLTSCGNIVDENDFDYLATMWKLHQILPEPIYDQVENIMLTLMPSPTMWEDYISVESVEIINEGQTYSESRGVYYVVIYPDEKGERCIQIDYRVYPDNASNTTVDFAYEEVDYATVDEFGVVTFTGPGVLKVRVIATDGSNAEDTILIIAK